MSIPILPELLDTCAAALTAAEKFLDQARLAVATQVKGDDKIDRKKLDAEQYAAHGFAWAATYVEALRQMLEWGRQLDQSGQFSELEQLIL
ncbi:MAG: acyl-CoA dehydrogenase, partial [Pseudomonadota bacterium]